MSAELTTSSSTDGAPPAEPDPEELQLPPWGRKARCTHRLRNRLTSDVVSRWSFLLSEVSVPSESATVVSDSPKPAVASMIADVNVEPPAKRLAKAPDTAHVEVTAPVMTVKTPDIATLSPAPSIPPQVELVPPHDQTEKSQVAHPPVKIEEPAAVPASVHATPGTVQHLLQYLMQAQVIDQQASSTQAAPEPAQLTGQPQKHSTHEKAAADDAMLLHGSPPSLQGPPPAPLMPPATTEQASETANNGATGLSDSIVTILQALQHQAAQQSATNIAAIQPRATAVGAGAAAPAAAGSADARRGQAHLPAATPSHREWTQDMQSVLRQLASGQGRVQEPAMPPAASMVQAQPMGTSALGHSAAVPASYTSPMQVHLAAVPRQHDVNQEKNKRIQEEANLLVRSGLINRPSSAALQALPPPRNRQQPPPPQLQARGVQLSSQSVLAHYNLHQQQQLAQQVQQRQHEQAAAVAQHLLQQQMRQRGHAVAATADAHGRHNNQAVPAQLSESEVQFLHAAHASGTLRNMQLQHAQHPPRHASPHQAQLHVPTPPHQHQPQQRPQHHTPDLHSILRALQGPPDPTASSQPMHRPPPAQVCADASGSSAERIESLRRQVSAHLRASGVDEGLSASQAGKLPHQQDHRPSLSEQLMHDIAASMTSAAQCVPGQHMARAQAVEAAHLLHQHALNADQQQQAAVAMTPERLSAHNSPLFQDQVSHALQTDAGHPVVSATVLTSTPQQGAHFMTVGTAASHALSAAVPAAPLQPMQIPAALSAGGGQGAAVPLLSSLIAGVVHSEARVGAFTAAPAAVHQMGTSQFPDGFDAATAAAVVAAAAGIHEGGEHESETENIRTKENPPTDGVRRCTARLAGADRGRSAFTVAGNSEGFSGGRGKPGGLVCDEEGGQRAADDEVEEDAGKVSCGSRGANENMQLLCKDRGTGADAQEGVLLEPAVS